MGATRADDLFLGLVASLQMSAWMQLGKVMNPVTGKIERDLDGAQQTIDLLGMLQEKTRGNLDAEEDKFLTRLLFDLRLNYVEERKSATASGAAPGASAAPPDAAGAAGRDAADGAGAAGRGAADTEDAPGRDAAGNDAAANP